MATRRTITTGLSNRLDADHVYLAMAVNMEFDSGHVRLWNTDDGQEILSFLAAPGVLNDEKTNP